MPEKAAQEICIKPWSQKRNFITLPKPFSSLQHSLSRRATSGSEHWSSSSFSLTCTLSIPAHAHKSLHNWRKLLPPAMSFLLDLLSLLYVPCYIQVYEHSYLDHLSIGDFVCSVIAYLCAPTRLQVLGLITISRHDFHTQGGWSYPSYLVTPPVSRRRLRRWGRSGRSPLEVRSCSYC